MKKWLAALCVLLFGCIISVVLVQSNGIGISDRNDLDGNTYNTIKAEGTSQDNEITKKDEIAVIPYENDIQNASGEQVLEYLFD